MESLDSIRIDLKFPLADGRTLVQGPLTYNQDGICSRHNADFMKAPEFVKAYSFGMQGGNPATQIQWRVHMALWCATQALTIAGDFVECGVHTGILSGAVVEWTNFAQHKDRTFYLFDTWEGIPEEQISDQEKQLGVSQMNRKYANGDSIFHGVQEKFKRWENTVITRGRVPDTLGALNECERIAYLSIDMNVVEAEMAAIERLWPKMTTGAMVLIDDYGWAQHVCQKQAWDQWADQNGVMILSLPTGQAIVRKS